MKIYQEKNYDDIINLPHPVSRKHPQMPLLDRAAQFSPFAALTGHEAAIAETARLTDEQMILDEDEKALIDGKLQEIKEQLLMQPKATITYYVPDATKAGGSYETITDCVRKIDEYERQIVFANGIRVKIDDIVEVWT